MITVFFTFRREHRRAEATFPRVVNGARGESDGRQNAGSETGLLASFGEVSIKARLQVSL